MKSGECSYFHSCTACLNVPFEPGFTILVSAGLSFSVLEKGRKKFINIISTAEFDSGLCWVSKDQKPITKNEFGSF